MYPIWSIFKYLQAKKLPIIKSTYVMQAKSLKPYVTKNVVICF